LQGFTPSKRSYLMYVTAFRMLPALRNYEDAPNTVISRWLVSAKMDWYLHRCKSYPAIMSRLCIGSSEAYLVSTYIHVGPQLAQLKGAPFPAFGCVQQPLLSPNKVHQCD
jgi:hypothetical protein